MPPCDAPPRRRTTLIALAAMAAAGPAGVRAQAAVRRLLYGFPPGSAGDVAARQLAAGLGGTWVENRAGAGGRLALEALKAAAPDGRTLALAPLSTLTLYPLVHARLGYDPQTDFRALARVAAAQHGLAVGSRVPAAVVDVAGLVAWLRAHPEAAHFGSPGAGSMPHLLGVLLGRATGLGWQHVPYRGAAPGVTELAGGQLAAMLAPAGDFLAARRAGRVRLLATSGAARWPFAAGVPTFAEQGWPALMVDEAFGLYAPAALPGAQAAALEAAALHALAAPALAAALATVGLVPQPAAGAVLAAQQRDEAARWAPRVRESAFAEAR